LLIDSTHIEPNQRFECDVCIIGGGPAGITLATKLSDYGIDVLLVESGGKAREPSASAQAMYEGQFSISAQNGTVLRVDNHYPSGSRLKGLGGTTNHWANWVRHLSRIDFEKRDWIPNSGWPITREDLDPFYVHAYEMCGVPSVPSEPPISLEQGTRFDVADSTIFNTQIYHIGLPPKSFGELFADKLEKSKKIRVLLHSTINRLELSKEKNKIKEINGITNNGRSFSVFSKYFVLSSGGIENARLLLANKDESGRSLSNSSGLVGKCFMEHLHVTFGQALLMNNNPDSFEYYNALGSYKRVGVFSIHSAIQRELKLTNIQFDIDPIKNEAKDKTTYAFDAIGKRFNPSLSSKFLSLRFILSQAPNRNSQVTLIDNEFDSVGLPKCKVDCRLSDLDLYSIKKVLELLSQNLGKAKQGFVRDLVNPTASWEGQNFEAAFSFYGYHHIGTTRMSESPSEGVVDKNCCSHDVSNLFLAGSSVFVTAGHAPPTLTIVALALRLAEHLRRKF